VKAESRAPGEATSPSHPQRDTGGRQVFLKPRDRNLAGRTAGLHHRVGGVYSAAWLNQSRRMSQLRKPRAKMAAAATVAMA